MKPEPFSIEIPESAIQDLRDRLSRARFASDFENEDWRYGTNGAYLRELIEYWRDGYDWRQHEAAMNEYAHYRVAIDGIPIHFIHERGKGPNPIPIVLTHGWPWTFWDYEKLIRPLTDPAAYGGDPADAFDVVVPSLPGFAFSSPLKQTGIHWGRTAELWHRLMREVLGYDKFAAQGGDWGAIVSGELGHRYSEDLIGIHVTLPGHPAFLSQIRPDDYGPGEEDWAARQKAQRPKIASHVAVHTSDPQTLAFSLNDSPIGLASWLVERRRAWSDCDGDVERRFSKDDLLTAISLYWFTETIGTSMRFYQESMGSDLRSTWWKPAHDRTPAIPTPTGVAVFVNELMLLPRRTAERASNLHQWSIFPSGGHFAPSEEPEILVDDIRSCFRNLR